MLEELAEAPALKRVADALRERFGDAVLETVYERKELSFRLGARDLPAVLEFLKTGHDFNALNDMIGLDRLAPPGEGRKRFEILYQLYRFSDHRRARVVVEVGLSESVPSIVSLYGSADWAEREIFDMFGIRFEGHPDLRRIYLAEDFSGHPLRKDFPLEG